MWRGLQLPTITEHIHEPRAPLANYISKNDVIKREQDAN
jgi:hypothetical protein